MEKLALEVLEHFKKVDADRISRDTLEALKHLDRKIVVLDDDPTGVQTVHGVSVYTSWDEEALTDGFHEKNSIFFILTNSRGLTSQESEKLHMDIARTLVKVSEACGKDYVLVSRSDSTLRGHYPLETDTLRKSVETLSAKRFDGEVIFPFFLEGGRYTISDIHYVREGSQLIPAGDTEFARDKSFGYKSSHLGEYVEEKTGGTFSKASCTYISLEDLRDLNLGKIVGQLMQVAGFNKVIVNAIDYVDVKIFAMAFIEAVCRGKEFIFRSAAALTKVLGGISDKPLLTKEQLIENGSKNGGIILIGSHVNKTTRQFEALRSSCKPLTFVEFNQHLVLADNGLDAEVDRVVAEVQTSIREGRSVVVYTRRDRFDLDSDDMDIQLQVSAKISDALTSVIGRLSVRPSFILAKGGITASDTGTKALQVKKALVLGQIKPGIPVWLTGDDSKFPQLPYIIFPGNVGEDDTLKEIAEMLSI